MSEQPLTLLSPAKLNLFLHITGRRSDGYHELQTLFQLLDWGDTITVSSDPTGTLNVECPGLSIPEAENLATRAARLLQEQTSTTAGAQINIEKSIPDGGGLGGGSSNAATVLLALNQLWHLNLPLSQLAEIGLSLGADVPVFVHGHSAWAEGIGEKITPLELPQRHYVILAPSCHVSTGEVFSHRQLTRNTSPITIAAFFEGGGRNNCEKVVRQLYPEVDKALNWLENFGQAQLTGTGACVFAAFESKQQAEAVNRQIPKGWRGFVAGSANRSPVHGSLE